MVPAWRVCTVPVSQLEDTLNELDGQGYELFDLRDAEPTAFSSETHVTVIMAQPRDDYEDYDEDEDDEDDEELTDDEKVNLAFRDLGICHECGNPRPPLD